MQQINFYLSLERPTPYAITFARFYKIMLSLFALILSVSLVQGLWLAYQSYHLRAVLAQQQQVDKEINALTASSANVKMVRKLEQSIGDLSAIIQQTNLIQKSIQQSSPYNISPYLIALAKASRSGIWITEITIKDHGDQIAIKGSVIDPILIPAFIKTLQQQPIFVQTPLRNFKISHQPEVSYADFILSAP